jgi:dihydropteroate synthase
VITVLHHDGPDDALGRIESLGIGRSEAAPLIRNLGGYLLLVTRDDGRLEETARVAADAGIPFARGAAGLLLSVASVEQAASRLGREGEPVILADAVREAVERCGRRRFELPCRGKTIALDDAAPVMMGVLNVTPDSFSDGGRYLRYGDAVRRGFEMAAAGAAVIDVGGESTRPGSAGVEASEEMDRVIPVVEALAAGTGAVLSVDTTKASVARAAAAAGAHVVNDTSALLDDPEMGDAVRETGCAVVLMHRRGTPATMQADPSYRFPVVEVLAELEQRLLAAASAGIPEDRIVVDPGIGFGKRLGDNLCLLRRLRDLRNLGRPILVGPSRKSFIGGITGRGAGERIFGTAASVAWLSAVGAHLVRVHDVREMREVAAVAAAIGSCRE